MKALRIKRFLLWLLTLPIALLAVALLVAYFNQDSIVQSQLSALNEGHEGRIVLGDVHLAPFENFPDISLKIDDVAVFESKAQNAQKLLEVADIYVGFNIWDIIKGNYDIHSLKVEDGFFDFIVHEDGTTNLHNALARTEESDDDEALKIHLNKIELKNLDIHHFQEESKKDVETLIYWAKGGFKSNEELIAAHVDSEFELNVIDNGDTTYIKHKHFEFHTDLTFDENTGMLVFKPSGIRMEHGDFELEGSLDTRNENTIDLKVKGTKPSFDMFIAFAPNELIPVLERYDNAGKIYFDLSLSGPTKGTLPFIDVSFGASEAYLENSNVKKRVDGMGFEGKFTNGAERNLETMEFSLSNMTAKLDKGSFIGDIHVKNFEAPDIDMNVDADFDIPFILSFLGFTEFEDTKGSVEMHMKFHDVIDIDNPQNALNDLNQAYFAELKIQDLAFGSQDLPAPLHDLDVHLEMKGKQAQLDQLDMELGNSKLSITGWLSDLPAIVHHSSIPVNAHLEIASELLDIAELTKYSEADSIGVNEQIKDLQLAFSFNALGNAFTEFQYLPKGEFFIDDLYADIQNYPHTLHDFHADVLIQDNDLNIVDFTGIIDESDFHFNGLIHDYSYWMQEKLEGDVDLDITIRSDLLKLEDLLSYKGENYMPEDYRHEEVEGLELHMESQLHYKDNELKGFDVQLDKLAGKMHVHPLRFEDFNGKFKLEKEHLVIKDFKGKMGRTKFLVDMDYYLGEDEAVKLRDNYFSLKSDFVDFDALSSFNLKEEEKTTRSDEATTEDVAAHAEAFNIYQLPFTDMKFNVDVGHFIYHRLDLQNIKAEWRTTHDHFIYLDTVSLDAAGGNIALNGVLNGSDPEHIFLEPNMRVSGVDLDKLLFKFENFGQDAIVSENLHGKLSADITGKVRLYPDFVADLDQSEVHLDAQVLNGRLENYDPMLLLSDYFGDKDLTNVRFDTLQNHMDITNGVITIPNMTIESTLGHMDISGTQNMNDSINYYARIPWSVVKSAARNKLFGPGKNEGRSEDEIVELDKDKKTKYLNVNISGTIDDFKVRLGKARK